MYVWIIQWYSQEGPKVRVCIAEHNAKEWFASVRANQDEIATIDKVRVWESRED